MMLAPALAQIGPGVGCTALQACTVLSLSVTNNGVVHGNLSVTGTLTTGAISFTNLTVPGSGTFGGTLGVTGNTTIGGTLGVTGLTTVTGGIALPSNLNISSPTPWTLTVNQIPITGGYTPTGVTANLGGLVPLSIGLNVFASLDASLSNGSVVAAFAANATGATKGGVTGAYGKVTLTAPTLNSSANVEYVGLRAWAYANTGDGGTALVPNGSLIGATVVGSAQGNATFLGSVSGLEVAVEALTGSSPAAKYGAWILSYNTDMVQGASADIGLGIFGQSKSTSTRGWKSGISFGSGPNGYWNPISSNGSFIIFAPNAGDTLSAVSVFDFSKLTSCSAWDYAAPNFTVACDGTTLVTSLGRFGGGNVGLVISGAGNAGVQVNSTDGALLQIGNLSPGTPVTTFPTISAGSGLILYATSGSNPDRSVAINGAGAGSVSFQPGGLVSIDQVGNVFAPSIGHGAGTFKVAGSGQWTANGTTATTMTSLGPAGAHTTIQKWLTVLDNTGATIYVPGY